MLCQKCWTEEARVHFCCVWGGETHEIGYCLACAQEEPLSWLLAWGNGVGDPTERELRRPLVVRVKPATFPRERRRSTLVATGLHRCECGCRIVVAANMPCAHGTYLFGTSQRLIQHECHCGREHTVAVPDVVCVECGAADTLSVVGTAETCSWDEQRRRLVAVNEDLQHGKATWGTFSIRN